MLILHSEGENYSTSIIRGHSNVVFSVWAVLLRAFCLGGVLAVKRATRNGDINNHIAEHHLQTNHRIDWDSAECITYSTNYYQRLTLESWFTNLEQTPLNRCLQLPAPYKRLIDDVKEIDKQ